LESEDFFIRLKLRSTTNPLGTRPQKTPPVTGKEGVKVGGKAEKGKTGRKSWWSSLLAEPNLPLPPSGSCNKGWPKKKLFSASYFHIRPIIHLGNAVSATIINKLCLP
jgi:hypothetical protein